MSCTTWPRRTPSGLQWPLANPAREDLPAQRNVGQVFATPQGPCHSSGGDKAAVSDSELTETEASSKGKLVPKSVGVSILWASGQQGCSSVMIMYLECHAMT